MSPVFKLYAVLATIIAVLVVAYRRTPPRADDDRHANPGKPARSAPLLGGYADSAEPETKPPAKRDQRLAGLAEFAGFFASHGVWCVSDDDEMLVPMLAWEDASGKRSMERFEGETRETIPAAQAKLEQNPNHAARVVLVVDGFITVNNVKRDALIIQAREFSDPLLSLHFSIAYRPQKAPGGFGVYRPALNEAGALTGFKAGRESGPGIDAFRRGIKSHEKGYAIWKNKQLE